MKPSVAPIILILAAAFSVLWPTSCTPSAERSRLTHIESIIDDRPDSALTLLAVIDTAALRSDADRALFAMLLTEALDKNHQNPTDDSLISEAIDYFALNGEPRREMIATYYGGRVQYLRGDFTHAIARFFRARELASDLGEHFWHGMAARGIADIFADSYNFGDQVRFAGEELEAIRTSGRQPYINYAMLDLAKAHYNYGEHDKAIMLANEIIDSAFTVGDLYLRKEALGIIGTHYLTEYNMEKAYPIILEICESGYAEPLDSTYLCLILSAMGDSETAISLSENLSEKDKIATSSIKYNYLRSLKRNEDALKELQNLYFLDVKEYKDKIRHNFSNTAIDYYTDRNLLITQELKNKKLLIALLVVSGLFAICALVSIAIYFNRRKNKEIKDKVFLAAQLQEQVGTLLRSHDMLQDSLSAATRAKDKSLDELEKKDATIRALLSSKYRLLDELSQIMIESNNPESTNRRIAEKVTTLINEISIGDKMMTDLEKQVNETHNNIMIDLRRQLPGLKEDDIRLFLFSALGFSSAVISLFLKEEKLSAVYNRKRRLKSKINTLESPLRERLLRILQ